MGVGGILEIVCENYTQFYEKEPLNLFYGLIMSNRAIDQSSLLPVDRKTVAMILSSLFAAKRAREYMASVSKAVLKATTLSASLPPVPSALQV